MKLGNCPVEYAALVHAPVAGASLQPSTLLPSLLVSASLILNTIPAGGTVLQTGCKDPFAQALVQLARKRGIQTVSVVSGMDQPEVVEILKGVGGDHVVTEEFALSHRFQEFMEGINVDAVIHSPTRLEVSSSVLIVRSNVRHLG